MWHRLKKWLKPKQDPLEHVRRAEELETLLKLENQGYFKVYFADESSFYLDSYLIHIAGKLVDNISLLCRKKQKAEYL